MCCAVTIQQSQSQGLDYDDDDSEAEENNETAEESEEDADAEKIKKYISMTQLDNSLVGKAPQVKRVRAKA